MNWVALIVAGVFEVIWASAMKQSEGFSKLYPSIITFLGMLISFGLLSLAMKSLPMGTAYTVWTGIGAIGAFLVGVIFLGEAFTLARAIAATFIVCDLILMKVSSHE